MAVNSKRVNLASDLSMPKVVGGGSGTITAPATSSVASNTEIIPNIFKTSNLIVALTATFKYGSLSTQRTQAPWISNDGRKSLDVTWNDDNIYIRATSSTAGAPEVATTFNYTYNIIML